MAEKILYDFEAAIKALMDAQSDVMMLVTKWSEMIASDAHYVTFRLKGQNGEGPADYSIPNIQMVIDNLTKSALPEDVSVNSVTTTTRQGIGRGKLTAGSLNFAGNATQGATYNVNGMEGISVKITDGARYTTWPIYRYMHAAVGENPTITIAPALKDKELHAGDFFVEVPEGSELTINFASYSENQKMVLHSTSGYSVWHIFVSATNGNSAGLVTRGRAIRMESI